MLLEEIYGFDLSRVLDRVPPGARVVHRSGDQVVPLEAGRELAAGLRDSRLVTLNGSRHLPWDGEAAEVLGALAPFLGGDVAVEPQPVPESVLTGREQEVLALVADGLGDASIAARLFLGPHTVHRHLANIRSKLGLSSARPSRHMRFGAASRAEACKWPARAIAMAWSGLGSERAPDDHRCMSTATAQQIKQGQRRIWAAGHYERIAELIAAGAVELVELAEVRAGERVLDVAAGPATPPSWPRPAARSSLAST